MSSIVLELQRAAMERSSDLGNLLRKSLVIATKLKLDEFLTWAEHELNGYPNSVPLPEYRRVSAELKCFNPYNNLWLPITFLEGTPERFRSSTNSQSIAEIQELVASDGDGVLAQNINPKLAAQLMQGANMVREPVLIIQRVSLIGILDAVRNTILKWTLKLEADGILGEGMTFTEKERAQASAHTTNYNIGTFQGVIGNVSGHKVTIGDYNGVHAQLKELGIEQKERAELERLMDEVPKAEPAQKKALIAQGLNWVVRNAGALGSLSNAIHEWFKNSA